MLFFPCKNLSNFKCMFSHNENLLFLQHFHLLKNSVGLFVGASSLWQLHDGTFNWNEHRHFIWKHLHLVEIEIFNSNSNR